MPFHSTTIFTLAHLLPLSLAHLPQQKTPFKLAILYNNSIADAHPSFLLEEAILFHTALSQCGEIAKSSNTFCLFPLAAFVKQPMAYGSINRMHSLMKNDKATKKQDTTKPVLYVVEDDTTTDTTKSILNIPWSYLSFQNKQCPFFLPARRWL